MKAAIVTVEAEAGIAIGQWCGSDPPLTMSEGPGNDNGAPATVGQKDALMDPLANEPDLTSALRVSTTRAGVGAKVENDINRSRSDSQTTSKDAGHPTSSIHTSTSTPKTPSPTEMSPTSNSLTSAAAVMLAVVQASKKFARTRARPATEESTLDKAVVDALILGHNGLPPQAGRSRSDGFVPSQTSSPSLSAALKRNPRMSVHSTGPSSTSTSPPSRQSQSSPSSTGRSRSRSGSGVEDVPPGASLPQTRLGENVSSTSPAPGTVATTTRERRNTDPVDSMRSSSVNGISFEPTRANSQPVGHVSAPGSPIRAPRISHRGSGSTSASTTPTHTTSRKRAQLSRKSSGSGSSSPPWEQQQHQHHHPAGKLWRESSAAGGEMGGERVGRLSLSLGGKPPRASVKSRDSFGSVGSTGSRKKRRGSKKFRKSIRDVTDFFRYGRGQATQNTEEVAAYFVCCARWHMKT